MRMYGSDLTPQNATCRPDGSLPLNKRLTDVPMSLSTPCNQFHAMAVQQVVAVAVWDYRTILINVYLITAISTTNQVAL